MGDPFKPRFDSGISNRGTDLHAKDDLGLTPLYHAVTRNNLDAVHALLDRGADPNFKNKGEETPLDHAAERNYLEAAAELIKAGAIYAQPPRPEIEQALSFIKDENFKVLNEESTIEDSRLNPNNGFVVRDILEQVVPFLAPNPPPST